MAAPDTLRPLGLAEQYSAVRNDAGIYNNVCVTARYSRSSTEPLRLALFRGLATVIAKHPILSAIPMLIDGRYHFVRLSTIDLNKIITILSVDDSDSKCLTDGTLDELLEKQHNKPFTIQSPPVPYWRICVLEETVDPSVFSLVFCFHHSLADTKSALVFHEDLERVLSDHSDAGVDSIVTTCDSTLLPPLEALLQLKTSESFVYSQKALEEPPAHIWSGRTQSVPTTTRFRSLWISKPTMAALQLKCKAKELSLTAVLTSLLASAFFQALPSAYTELHGDCAVSLRRYFTVSEAEHWMGCYVGSFSEAFKRGSGTVWEDAGRTRVKISETVEKRGADMPVGYLRHVADLRKWFASKIGKKRWAAWELSNVGTLSVEEGGHSRDCKIESVLFSQSASACSGAVKVSTVTGRDGQLAIGFSWQQDIVEESTVESVMGNVRELITQITSERS